MDYDREVEKIKEQNEPLLAEFEEWLKASGLSAKTINNHYQNITFFAEYLVYYEPLEPLIDADEFDVNGFCGNWFPRKAMWASANSARSNMTTFRKFSKFMVDAGHWSANRNKAIREMLKTNKDEFIEVADSYYDSFDGW